MSSNLTITRPTSPIDAVRTRRRLHASIQADPSLFIDLVAHAYLEAAAAYTAAEPSYSHSLLAARALVVNAIATEIQRSDHAHAIAAEIVRVQQPAPALATIADAMLDLIIEADD